jgi:hypothetical protein
LGAERDRCNSLVAQARRTYADFDVDLLVRQIRGPLGEVVGACERMAPGSGARVLAALFEPVVELVAQHRLGGGTHDELMARLAGLAPVLVTRPRLVFGSAANALVHLAAYGVSPAEWLERVERAAGTGDAATALRAGQVAAWALGLSHFRSSALSVASTLTGVALAAALGVEEPAPVGETVKRLEEDRWWQPGRATPERPAVVHRAGGFRGFGGPFLAPPRAMTRAGHIVICSGDEAWTLHADAWGATLTRTDAGGAVSAPPGSVFVPPGIRPITAAAVDDVAALTVATSYQVLVVPS